MTVLDDIIVAVRADLAEREQRTPLADLQEQVGAAPPARDPISAGAMRQRVRSVMYTAWATPL